MCAISGLLKGIWSMTSPSATNRLSQIRSMLAGIRDVRRSRNAVIERTARSAELQWRVAVEFELRRMRAPRATDVASRYAVQDRETLCFHHMGWTLSRIA